jgi:hypothetical protein
MFRIMPFCCTSCVNNPLNSSRKVLRMMVCSSSDAILLLATSACCVAFVVVVLAGGCMEVGGWNCVGGKDRFIETSLCGLYPFRMLCYCSHPL